MVKEEIKDENLILRISKKDKEILREYAYSQRKGMSEVIRDYIITLEGS